MSIAYTIIRSKRARRIHLSVAPGGIVRITVPLALPTRRIATCIGQYAQWIERAQKKMMHVKTVPVRGRRDYKHHKEAARVLIAERVAYWSAQYGFTYARIAIKDTTRAWGSCSARGNLNFSYKLLFLPRELMDYVIVHEVCHLKEQNHSHRFWAQVAHAVPDYQQRRNELRRYVLG
jgi:predicted metal-dependent hydrolase